ncbi:hypothetical protein IE81DRAFT_343680 [Ceraceosorus guamensis]|uniref:Uncharacterized protein n=1 Tax=Ceraceosorus guamensis TaxID=1522189 RepID=A0A316VNK1_9BASI|nr:hypothetical protein IE81DRAFT_343680 [Ceraceosorus guamensis]PWN38884.1 hypothetical protein IE81DRAFT_343680 [Ceraceosorus guamensis]
MKFFAITAFLLALGLALVVAQETKWPNPAYSYRADKHPDGMGVIPIREAWNDVCFSYSGAYSVYDEKSNESLCYTEDMRDVGPDCIKSLQEKEKDKWAFTKISNDSSKWH